MPKKLGSAFQNKLERSSINFSVSVCLQVCEREWQERKIPASHEMCKNLPFEGIFST